LTREQRYMLEVTCGGIEEHDGSHWIGEEDLEKIKRQAAENVISESCSLCKLTAKDADGNIIFVKEGC